MTETTTGGTAVSPFLNAVQACALFEATGLKMSRTTFELGVASGKFPAAIRLTPRRPVWRKSELDALIAGL
jgi:predicted DNA-binding transcriptional regulator AlpA